MIVYDTKGQMISHYRIENGSVVPADEANASVHFIYALASLDKYMEIAEMYGIEAHAIRSALDPEEVARLDHDDDDYISLICKRPRQHTQCVSKSGDSSFRVSSLGLFLFKDKLVLISDEEIPLSDFHSNGHPFQNIQDIALNLIHRSTLHFSEEFRNIHNQVLAVESKLWNSTSDKQLRALFAIEKDTIRYLNSLGGNNALLERIKHESDCLRLGKKQIAFLKNMMIDSHQCYQQADVASDIMASLTETSASLVSNKLANIMKRLTIISLIFMPINAIAGIGGMSEFTSAADKLGLSMWFAYALLCLGMIGVAFLTYSLIRKIENE